MAGVQTTNYVLFSDVTPNPAADDFSAAATESWETVGASPLPADDKATPAAAAAAATASSAGPKATFAPLAIDPFALPVEPLQRKQSQRKQSQDLQAPASAAAAASEEPEAGRASPAPALPPRKQCSYASCDRDRFARGFCALHLSEATSQSAAALGAAPTPTTRIRQTYNLWSRSADYDAESRTFECTWRLSYDDGEHVIMLFDNPYLGVRAVTINGKEVYCDSPELGSWKLDATIGHSFNDSINIKVVVSTSPKGYNYECFVDNVKFDDAHQAFLSKLSGASMLQRLQLNESRGDSQALEELRGQQLQESIYIRENWHEQIDEAKTPMGYLKSKVSWSFTISGVRHVVVLEYSAGSGKRKVLLDGGLVFEEKPALLSINKHKKFSLKFRVDGVECEVTAEKNESGVRDPRDEASALPRPFLFNFLIEGVPFEACTQTESDLAGGNISIDTEAQAVTSSDVSGSAGASASSIAARAASPPVVASGRRYSLHKPMSAAEYEAALQEANERERLDAEVMREARRAAKEQQQQERQRIGSDA